MKSIKPKMQMISNSKSLIENTKGLLQIQYKNFFFSRSSHNIYCGWGRKHSGLSAVKKAKKSNAAFLLLEDGFIRSIGLGVDGSPSFSIVKDDIGIYYDATAPSRLEKILNEYDFDEDIPLLEQAEEAIKLIIKHKVSKYNSATSIPKNYFSQNSHPNILIIAQTAQDQSIQYGLASDISLSEIIDVAIAENPDANIFVKLHPDTLEGKKKSDIDIKSYASKCTFIVENINPISLLQNFHHVYTKTSQMGFEALLLGKQCTCFGMPFYAGWGITNDKISCSRRKRKLNVTQIFAAAYILYTQYYNPYTQMESDIFDTIDSIIKLRNLNNV